jgi:PAS domain S-box-containing protein
MIADDLKTLKRITDTLVSNGYLVDQTKEWEYAFDAVPDAIFVINLNHRIRYINRKLSSLLNKTRDEVFNLDCYKVIIGDQSLCDFSECKMDPVDVGEVYLDKLRGWFEITQAPIKSGNDKLLGFICILRDVTDRKHAQEKLRQLAQFPAENPNPVLRVSAGGVLLYANSPGKKWLDQLGWAGDGSLPENLVSMVHKIYGTRERAEQEIKNKDNSVFWVMAVHPEESNYVNIYSVDITERYVTRCKLEQSEATYRTIVKNAPVGLYEVDFATFKLSNVNDLMVEYTGYSQEELLSMDVRAILTTESQRLFISRIKDSIDGKPVNTNVEFEIKRKNGETRWIQIHTSYKFNDLGMPIGARVVAFDIDEKKRARLETERKTRMLESIYRSSPGAIGVVRYPERTIVWVNDKIEAMTGYTQEELIGKNARVLYASDEDYKNTGNVKYRLMLDSPEGVGTVKTRWRCKNGNDIDILLISSKIKGEENRVVFNALDLDFICENTELAVCI